MNDIAGLAGLTDDTVERIIQPMTQRAMLARLKLGLWTAVKTDKKLSRESAKANKSDESMISTRKRLLAKSALEKITKAAQLARDFHKDNTLPWEYEGVGVLHSKNFFNYLEQMRKYERDFQAAVAAFLPNYDSLISEAAKLLGPELFNQKDYPHPQTIARRFYFQVDLSKIELGKDFRVPDIGDEANKRIQREIDLRTNQAVDGMVRAVWEQVAEHVKHMVERLTAYNERVEKPASERGREGTFTDAMVDNLRDFVERMPILNMTNAPEVDEMRVRLLRQLCRDNAEDLRQSPLTRKDVLAKAQQILADVSEFLA